MGRSSLGEVQSPELNIGHEKKTVKLTVIGYGCCVEGLDQRKVGELGDRVKY